MRLIKKLALATVVAGSLLNGSPLMASPGADSKIALQMYTLRNVGTLDQQFLMARNAGFTAVELVGDQGVSSAELNRLLAQYNLSVTSAHVQLDALRSQMAQTIAFNQAIGNKVLVVPYLQPADRPTDAAGWKRLGKELNALGSTLRKSGLQLAYHNHDFEMKTFRGKTGFELLVDATRAENLALEIDAAWVFRGGQDPVRLIHRYADRLFALHAKDNSGIGLRDDEMNFAPVGEGLLAWDEIVSAAQQRARPVYVVEHDLPKDADAIIRASKLSLERELAQAWRGRKLD
ncbi:sugar phosphate isomerase/epimerase [Pseudomonas sp. 21LCFQ010]|uniref:sugar phosphate isomerase/epimerase family protein n=1 Tax=Pseudomonas sp. 21LCFQ010 TaxID=2957506 RepID=UPI002098546B|nr:sugar phosphate isomerase/epimerase [Pseudomonas sp. 21LCFQ010]MCO8165949.1 sugar phosphate isomerase/epimerase [Pseudomonas sp. 21LCFQ010]